MGSIWAVELMYPAEFGLFRLCKPDYVRIKHVEKIKKPKRPRDIG